MKTNEKELTKLIEETIDKGATTAEEIHRAITNLPITVLERLGASEETTQGVRKVQDSTIGAIYELVHDINHKVLGLASDLIEDAPAVKQAASKKSPKKKAAPKPAAGAQAK